MNPVEVAVAVIPGADNTVLVSQRAANVHLAGLWEFPGGKLEPGESAQQALRRELREEIGIEVEHATPIMSLSYAYPEKNVILHIFKVSQFRHQPIAREQQPLRYQAIASLCANDFPAANRAIIRWLQLSEYYFITPVPDADTTSYLQSLENVMRQHRCVMQLRAPNLDSAAYHALANQLGALCQTHNTPLLLNCSLETFQQRSLPAAGLHLSAVRAAQYQERPIDQDLLLGCSCHNQAELRQAMRLQADFVVLSLVKPSRSHPHAAVMGWEGFAQLSGKWPFAVYALGGMQIKDLSIAQSHGARGIAAIRAFLA